MKRYILIGAGGTGSHFISAALPYLKAYHDNNGEDWEFLVVDGDNYESKNLSRQLFNPEFVGLNKADTLAQMYQRYPVYGIPKFLGRQDLPAIILENSVVLIGVDNYSLRAIVEQHVSTLDNAVVINAGNEYHDGSVQLWVRDNGENKTPRLSYGHPEIRYIGEDDRAFMSCQEVAQLPGGEQLIIANMAAAQHMLTALWRYHSDAWRTGWTELQFDLLEGRVDHIDMRERRNWAM